MLQIQLQCHFYPLLIPSIFSEITAIILMHVLSFLEKTSSIFDTISILNIFFSFLEPHLRHMEVSRLGVKSELQLLAYIYHSHSNRDPSQVCDLHHSSQQHRILTLLSEARVQTSVQMDTWVCNLLSHKGNSQLNIFFTYNIIFFKTYSC